MKAVKLLAWLFDNGHKSAKNGREGNFFLFPMPIFWPVATTTTKSQGSQRSRKT